MESYNKLKNSNISVGEYLFKKSLMVNNHDACVSHSISELNVSKDNA